VVILCEGVHEVKKQRRKIKGRKEEKEGGRRKEETLEEWKSRVKAVEDEGSKTKVEPAEEEEEWASSNQNSFYEDLDPGKLFSAIVTKSFFYLCQKKYYQ
jgi:hypothetical protein